MDPSRVFLTRDRLAFPVGRLGNDPELLGLPAGGVQSPDIGDRHQFVALAGDE